MKLTPSCAALWTTFSAAATSAGGPQTPGPVIRMAPKPRRFTFRSPPSVIWPAAAALGVAVMVWHLESWIKAQETFEFSKHYASAPLNFSPMDNVDAVVI